MKPTHSSSPSPALSCRLVRLTSVLADNGTPSANHLSTCEACRAFFASANELEMALRLDAPKRTVAVPHGVEDRILRAVRNAAPPREEAGRSFLSYATLGGAVVAAAAVAVFEFSPSRHSGPGPVANTSDYRTDAAELAAAVREFPSDLKNRIAQPASALTQNNPLQREAQNVYTDAQSALAFLRMNFLPGEAQVQPSST